MLKAYAFYFSILCAKSIIIHASVTYKLIKTGMGENCNVEGRTLLLLLPNLFIIKETKDCTDCIRAIILANVKIFQFLYKPYIIEQYELYNKENLNVREYNKLRNCLEIGEMQMNLQEIAYQNKDIASKALAELLKGKSFRVYGLNLPKIKKVLPTNIPTVKANELRIDNLFELTDGTAAIVDYESDYDNADKVKYLNYMTGIANRYLNENKKCPKLRMIVIYTGDIRREQVSTIYDIGAIKVNIEAAFLSELDAEGIYRRLKEKVDSGTLLSDEELMEFIIFPLAYRDKEEKKKKIHEAVNLAILIQDRKQQIFILAGILTFTDKLIDKEAANKIRRAIEMTQVARIFEEEKQQALTQVARIFEEEKQQALIQAAKTFEEEKRQAVEEAAKTFEEEKRQAVEETEERISKKSVRELVVRMIEKGYSVEEIVSLVPDFAQEDVEVLRKELPHR